MVMLEILLGYIPEAIYFSLFMIFTKQLKEKRLLYITLMILDYLLLKQFIHFSIYFQIAYTFMSFIILKVLYKEKSQVIDIFTFTIGSIILILTSMIMYVIALNTYNDTIICNVLHKILIFVLLFVFRNKLSKIQSVYKKLWNRNDKVKKKIKTTTFRSLNVIIFNITFYVINIGMVLATLWKGR